MTRNKVVNRFTFIARFIKQPDKAVSKNEYDRSLGYSFQIANRITVQRNCRDSLTHQTAYFRKCLAHSGPILIRLKSHLDIARDSLEAIKLRFLELIEFLNSAPEEVFAHKLNFEIVPPIAKMTAPDAAGIKLDIVNATDLLQTQFEQIRLADTCITALPAAESIVSALQKISEKCQKFITTYKVTFDGSGNIFFNNVTTETLKLAKLIALIETEVQSQIGKLAQLDEEFLNRFMERIMFNYQEALQLMNDLSDQSNIFSEGMRLPLSRYSK